MLVGGKTRGGGAECAKETHEQRLTSLKLFIDLHDMCMPLGVFWSCWCLYRAKCPCVVDAQMCKYLFLGCVVGAALL